MNVDNFLAENEIANFIIKNNFKFSNRLTDQLNYPRVVSLAYFYKLHQELSFEGKIGIVSGSMNDPEVSLLESAKYTFEIMSYEDDPRRYNLDTLWEEDERFDLVLCNQVLEHIFNPHIAFSSLKNITKKGGYIWVSIPTVNCIHGEPDFYSSGFHPRFFSRIAKQNSLEIIHIGCWGNKKYLTQCVLGRWLTYRQLKPGVHNKADLAFPYYIHQDGTRNEFDKNVITDTWALFRKPVDEI